YELKAHLLGRLSSLQLHHIFPKALLYNYGYGRQDVNAIANFTFLTQDTNLLVSDADPQQYLDIFEEKHPGILASHWIPMDRYLWRVENYLEFLEARRELLARAANDFLDSLLAGAETEEEEMTSILEREIEAIPGRIESEEEEEMLPNCRMWMEQQGLPIGDLEYELVNDETKQQLATLDLAWPEGIQVGRSQPVALLIDEDDSTLQIAQRNGYRCFTDYEQFKAYVRDE